MTGTDIGGTPEQFPERVRTYQNHTFDSTRWNHYTPRKDDIIIATSYKSGTRMGPQAIIEASKQIELWDHELASEPWRVGIHSYPTLAPTVEGPAQMVNQIEMVCRKLLNDKKFIFPRKNPSK